MRAFVRNVERGAKAVQAGGGLEKKVEAAWLFAFYGPLLTQKQQDALRLYLEEDMSLSEIAGEQQISRQGVHEALRRAYAQLYEFEGKLHMAKRFSAMHEGLKSALEALNAGESEKAKSIIMELKRRDEEEENGL